METMKSINVNGQEYSYEVISHGILDLMHPIMLATGDVLMDDIDCYQEWLKNGESEESFGQLFLTDNGEEVVAQILKGEAGSYNAEKAEVRFPWVKEYLGKTYFFRDSMVREFMHYIQNDEEVLNGLSNSTQDLGVCLKNYVKMNLIIIRYIEDSRLDDILSGRAAGEAYAKARREIIGKAA